MLDSELTNNGTDDNDGAEHGGNGTASSGGAVDRQAEAATVPAAVPAVLFQGPQVVFQPPQTAPAYGAGRTSGASGARSAGYGTGVTDSEGQEAQTAPGASP